MKLPKDQLEPIMTNSENIVQFGPNAYSKPTAALIVPRRVHVKTTTTARPRPDDVADLKLET